MQTAEGKFEMDYETLIEQATEAQTLLAQLLECNCKYSITLSWIEIFTYFNFVLSLDYKNILTTTNSQTMLTNALYCIISA